MGPLPQILTIGANYDSPLIRLTNGDFSLGGVSMDRGIDFSGQELVIDDLTVIARMSQATAQATKALITVDGKTFQTSEGELFLTTSGIPKDQVLIGYTDFFTSDGTLFMTSNGQAFQVPVLQALDDFWESVYDGVAYGIPVWYEVNGERYKFYWETHRRSGKFEFTLTAQSAIGILDRIEDNGGMYAGEPLPEVLYAILVPDGRNAIVPYTVDSAIHGIRVYGWMPIQTKRKALQQLLSAYGIIIRRDGDGDMYFTLPPTGASELPFGSVFLGGSVERNDDKKYSRVDVTEYTFLQTNNDKEVTLFDNTTGGDTAENLKVTFSQAPVYGLESEELTVHETHCNFAVLSGVGTLTGKQYTQVTQITSVEGRDAGPYVENVLSFSGVPLINYLNSEFTAKRLRDWCNADATVKMDFIRTGQNPGDLVHFTDPYGKERTGYLTAIPSKATSFDRARNAVAVCGYTPQYYGNAWDSVRVFTDAITLTIDDDLDGQTLRIVLISGGQGGYSGQHGSDRKADGGGHGTPGSGGKVLTVKVAVQKGDTLAISPGSGGTGGEPSDETETVTDEKTGTEETRYVSNPGEEGSPSRLVVRDANRSVKALHTSASGASIALGYQDIINGNRYAQIGPDFGVDGGPATTAKENGNREAPGYTDITQTTLTLTGSQWGDREGTSWTSGTPGDAKSEHQTGDNEYYSWAYGGLGGGPAVGNNGSPGGNAPRADGGGRGGNGADASPLFPINPLPYGTGGSGGHGGGQAGTGGTGHTTEEGGGMPTNGSNGAGGNGSAGQPGQPGCVLLYYRLTSFQFYVSADGHLICRYSGKIPSFTLLDGHLLCHDAELAKALFVRGGHLWRVESDT